MDQKFKFSSWFSSNVPKAQRNHSQYTVPGMEKKAGF